MSLPYPESLCNIKFDNSLKKFDEIIEVLKETLCAIQKSVVGIESERIIVEGLLPINYLGFEVPIMATITKWIDFLNIIQYDIERLIAEMEVCVEQRHINYFKKFEGEIEYRIRNTSKPTYSSFFGGLNEAHKIQQSVDNAFATYSEIMWILNCKAQISARLDDFLGHKSTHLAKSKRLSQDLTHGLFSLEGKSWSSVKIIFLNDEMVEIRIGDKPHGAKRFYDLGFQDKRKKTMPNVLWKTLIKLAQDDGVLTVSKGGAIAIHERKRYEKNISLLKKKMKSLFSSPDDPFRPFDHKIKAYRTIFSISYRNEVE
jgi:hypothetical protein